jgi:hypothetical protein
MKKKEKTKRPVAGDIGTSSESSEIAKQPTKPRRENFKLPEKSAQDLERLSLESGVTKTEIVRQGIALMRIFWDESKQGNRLALVGSDDRVVKELVMP